jgi:hypothetical protein
MRKSFSIKLDIPTPCHEDWDKMTPNEKGRHCDSCNKTVVDFTNYTDKQLAEFFSKIKGSVCGRLTSSQMQTQLVYAEPSRYSFLHKLLFGTAMTLSLTGSANGNYIPSAPQLQNPVAVNNDTKPKHFNPTHYIEGMAIDSQSNEHLADVRLAFLYNGHIIGETKTDAKGHYKFHLDGIYVNKEITITRTYDYGNYDDFSQLIKVTHLPYHFDINLNQRKPVEVVGTRVPLVPPRTQTGAGTTVKVVREETGNIVGGCVAVTTVISSNSFEMDYPDRGFINRQGTRTMAIGSPSGAPHAGRPTFTP